MHAGSAADVTDPVKAYMKALNASDIEAVLALFTDDGSLMANEAPTAVGPAELRATFTRFFSMLEFGRQLHVDEAFTGGDVGVVRSHTTGTLTMRATDTRIEAVSRELFVLQRVGDRWRIRSYMFNAAAPAQHG